MQLRYFIPLIILASGLALTTLLSVAQWRTVTTENTEESIAQANALGLFAAAQIEAAYRNQTPANARDVINHLGSFQNIIAAVLFDSGDQVLYATDFRLAGKPLSETFF